MRCGFGIYLREFSKEMGMAAGGGSNVESWGGWDGLVCLGF